MQTDDALRELKKIDDALGWALRHEQLVSESNAALHCNDVVMYSTLYQRLAAAHASAEKLFSYLEHQTQA